MGKRKEITQEDRVLMFMKDTGSITSWQAIQQFGITRLSAKIFNLRREGYEITNKMRFSKNRYGEQIHFVEYVLDDKPKRNPFEGLFRIFGMHF